MPRPKGTQKDGLKYLDENQLKKFFKEVDQEKDIKYKLLFRLTLFLGLRVQEAARIQLSDINFESKQITIKALKGGRKNTYTLDGKIWYYLKKYLKTIPKDSEFLFPHRKYYDHAMTADAIKYIFKKYIRKAGLDNQFSIHALRHSCGIIRTRRGATPQQVMLWLRHRSVMSTQVYFEQVRFESDNEKAQKDFQDFL